MASGSLLTYCVLGLCELYATEALSCSCFRALPGESGVNRFVTSPVNLIPSDTRERYVFKTAAAECDADRLNDFGDIEHFPLLEFSQGTVIPEDYVLTSVSPLPLK